MKPRHYQEEAVNSIFTYFENGGQGNPLVVMPTATGKSVVIGSFCERAYTTFPGTRIMMLTHVKELIEQNYEKLKAIWPMAPAGIYSASVGQKEDSNPITFGGIQSVVKKPERFGHQDLVLIDEAHLVSPNQKSSYQKFLRSLKEVNPYLKTIGLTATPFRLGQGRLIDDGLFTDVCYDLSSMDNFNSLIDDGFLAPLIPKPTRTEIDLSDVHVRGGEFVNRELQAATDRVEVTRAALQETIQVAHDRNHWLIFCTGIEHCEHVSQMLTDFGISNAVVHSKVSKQQREEALEGARSGKYRALVNNGVLTTGYDFPELDLIVMLRATASPGLLVQMLGRGIRPVYAPGYDLETVDGRLSAMAASCKQSCLVLDFARNIPRLGPINDPRIPTRKGKGGGTAPVRLCDQCSTYLHASIRVCPHCGYTFPISVKFDVSAGTTAIIQREAVQHEEMPVDRVVFSVHKKKGKPDSMKVTYYCGLLIFSQYVCIEHEGFASKWARDWWRKAWSCRPDSQGKNLYSAWIPQTTEQAIKASEFLPVPKMIKVWINTKYPEVVHINY